MTVFETKKHVPMYPTTSKDSKYIKIQGTYTWVIREDLDPSTIHVQTSCKEGYGGRTVKFQLTDGTELEMVGPWNSGSDALYRDTSFDVRNNHYTFVVVAKKRNCEGNNFSNNILEDVLYQDTEWTLGSFKRGDEIANKIANELGEPVYLYSTSYDGSSCGRIEPNKGDK
jgi:hypothetical protein